MFQGMDIRDVVIQYLHDSALSSESPELEAAVQHYIDTRDTAAKKRILSPWVKETDLDGGVDPCSGKHKRRRTDETGDLDRAHDEVQAPGPGLTQDLDEAGNQRREDCSIEAPNRETGATMNSDLGERHDVTPAQGFNLETNEGLEEQFGRLQRKAVAFFASRGRKKPLTWAVALKALVSLQEGYVHIKSKGVSNLWDSETGSAGLQACTDAPPLQRLTMLHESFLSSIELLTLRRRFTSLLMYHESKESGTPMAPPIAKRKRRGAKKVSQVEETKIGADHTNAYKWMKFIEAWGLGGLVLPGSSHTNVFERSLVNDNAADLYAFCLKYTPHLVQSLAPLHKIVKTLLVEAVKLYGGNETLLAEGGKSILAVQYRTPWTQGTEESLKSASAAATNAGSSPGPHLGSTGIDMLVRAADHHRSQEDTTRPGIQPAVEMCESRNDGMQDPTALTSATQEASASSSQMWEVGTPGAVDRRQDFMELEPQMHAAMGSRGSNDVTNLEPPSSNGTVFPPGHSLYSMPTDNSSAMFFGQTSQFCTDDWFSIFGQGDGFIESFEMSHDDFSFS